MKVVFICGSPRGKESCSYQVAKYLAHFLDEEFNVEFIRLDAYRLEPDISRTNPEFEGIIARFQDADFVVWAMGIHVGNLPASLKLLIEYIFQHYGDQNIFDNTAAASICTSGRLFDDVVLRRIRALSEAMGMTYLDEIAITGNQGLFYDDDEYTEAQARRLAGVINQHITSRLNLKDRKNSALRREWLQPVKNHPDFPVISDARVSSGEKSDKYPLIILSSRSVKLDKTAAYCVEIIRNTYREGPVEVLSLEDLNLKRCVGCLWCNHYGDGRCKFQDDLDSAYAHLKSFSRIIVLTPGTGASDDYYHKVFIDRIWVDIHREALKSTYGGIVMYGSGDLGQPSVDFMIRVYRLLGVNIVHSIPDLFNVSSNVSDHLESMITAIKTAHMSKDPVPVTSNLLADRRCIAWISARWGYVLVTDYDYLKKKGVFTWRERLRNIPGRILFSNPARYRKLLEYGRKRLTRKRIERLKLKLVEMKLSYRPTGFGDYD